MSIVNTMYQYSLASYLQVFDLSLRKSMPDSILPKRLKNIMETLQLNVYNYACTGQWVLQQGWIGEGGEVQRIALVHNRKY